MTSSRPITNVSRQIFKKCSDLPPVPPLFSCDACDRWRNRGHSVHFKKRSMLNRSDMSARYQCSQKKNNMDLLGFVSFVAQGQR